METFRRERPGKSGLEDRARGRRRDAHGTEARHREHDQPEDGQEDEYPKAVPSLCRGRRTRSGATVGAALAAIRHRIPRSVTSGRIRRRPPAGALRCADAPLPVAQLTAPESFPRQRLRIGARMTCFGIDAVLSYCYTHDPRRAAAPGGAPRWRDKRDASGGLVTGRHVRAGRASRARAFVVPGERGGTLANDSSHPAPVRGCPLRVRGRQLASLNAPSSRVGDAGASPCRHQDIRSRARTQEVG